MNKKLVIALAGGLALGFVSATSYAEPPPAAPAPGSDTKDVKKDVARDFFAPSRNLNRSVIRSAFDALGGCPEVW